ncbi:MAG: flagellar basal body L-ring protein FlgH [Myxococcales bacterium]|nr:flagellar basal body L-ring protein FlgH [Myxococcales bacterium]
MKLRSLVVVLLLATAAPACGPAHVSPFTARQRVYKKGNYAQAGAKGKPTNGSLWSDASGGMLEDPRAGRVGDIVLVKIDEVADATGQADTKLKKEGSASAGATAILGIMPALKKAYPNLDPAKLFEVASKENFAGEGGTSRKGELHGSISVRVVDEMPNGDLFIEGTKVVMINNEEAHLYLSGLIRPADITQDNSVSSSRIADAQIEFTGRGDVADQQRKGWLRRLVDALNPF